MSHPTHDAISERLKRVRGLHHGELSDRRVDTQARLLEAGRRIIADHGVGGASVGLITSEAGFTRGAFYSNFTDMDHFVQMVAAREWARMLERLRLALSSSSDIGAPAADLPEDDSPTDEGRADHEGGAAETSDITQALRNATAPLMSSIHLEARDDALTTFTEALIRALPRDRDTLLLFNSLSNFMMRSPEHTDQLRTTFLEVRQGIANYLVEALRQLGLRSRLEPLDLADTLLAIGMRATRDSHLTPSRDHTDLLDRVIPLLAPVITEPLED